MKSFNKFLLSATFLGLVISCGGSGESDDEENIDPNELVKVEGGKYKGGILRLNSIEDYTSLFPVGGNDVYSTHIAGNAYEGLFRFNQKTLETEPNLAESFDIDQSKTVYTFKIRKGVKFHDDECFDGGEGREVTASDFKYCLDFVCTDHASNKWSSLFSDIIKGVDDFKAGKTDDVSGIVVKDKHTLEITLENPLAAFTDMLALLSTAVYPKEAVEHYGYDGMNDHMVGTGPFVPVEVSNGTVVKFKRNKNYWRKDDFGNQLPLLSEVHISFIKDKKEELDAFKNEELDMVWGLPVEEIPNIMGTLDEAKEGKNREFEVQSVNALNIQYYGFKNTSEVFGDINVRRAFNYAIDRDSLVEFVLDGEGIAAHNGFVPPMTGYPYESVKGFEYNPKRAKQLMAKAGYAGGKGFPKSTLYITTSGGVNVKIAEFVREQLKANLGVDIEMESMPMSELYPKVESHELDFWRFGWIADYPDPATFLHLFHSTNFGEGGNYFDYTSEEFDKMYESAVKEIDPEKRNALYAKADQIIIDDAVVMPLMFTVGIRLINPQIKNFDINQMEYRDLSVVYMKEKAKSKTRVYDNLGEEEEGYVPVVE
ncbi:MAG: ABC transporter substrate-binding protein [Crocinitomicaceae bacterium]|nr:ABC transporter substrate-binding protein [Crocinitomicaceae bacterium]